MSKGLKDWFEAHVDNPYPSEMEKEQIAIRLGMRVNQVASWFGNQRQRQRRNRKHESDD